LNPATMALPDDATLTNDEILDLMMDENDQLREGYARTLSNAASEKAMRWCLRHLCPECGEKLPRHPKDLDTQEGEGPNEMYLD
jgi:hypothetical protein